MMARMVDKVALVVGGAKGIGLAVAERLAIEGASVVFTGRRTDEVEAAAARIGKGARGLVADAARQEDLHRVVATVRETHGRIDALVSAATRDRAAAEADQRTADADVTLDVTRAYWSFVTARETARVVEQGLGEGLGLRRPFLREDPGQEPRRGVDVPHFNAHSADKPSIKPVQCFLGDRRRFRRALDDDGIAAQVKHNAEALFDPREICVIRSDKLLQQSIVGKLAGPMNRLAHAGFLTSSLA